MAIASTKLSILALYWRIFATVRFRAAVAVTAAIVFCWLVAIEVALGLDEAGIVLWQEDVVVQLAGGVRLLRLACDGGEVAGQPLVLPVDLLRVPARVSSASPGGDGDEDREAGPTDGPARGRICTTPCRPRARLASACA